MVAPDADSLKCFVSLYAEYAILLLSGRDPLVGQVGVCTFFASLKARGICEIKLTTLELEAFADTAWERGSSEMIGPEGAPLG